MNTPRSSQPVSIDLPSEGVSLAGDLTLPEGARGLVIFAHGSGSSRHSPRNQAVAGVLVSSGLGTLLLDLLTPQEEQQDRVAAALRFDIALLCRRLVGAIDWVEHHPKLKALPIGLFGASTGAAGALCAAAQRSSIVRAVVSRGGRPDLAAGALSRVTAPTLLIVGERDTEVIRLNRDVLAELGRKANMVTVPGATHLFEEPGALEQVSKLALDWFLTGF
jgi:dienelactone hydrolase